MEPLFNATGAWLGCHEPACGYTTVGWSLAIAGTSCLMSFFCSLGLAWMDKRRNRYKANVLFYYFIHTTPIFAQTAGDQRDG